MRRVSIILDPKLVRSSIGEPSGFATVKPHIRRALDVS
jgi:hypothetical protein